MSFASPAPTKKTEDLSWVEFSEDEAQSCMALTGCDKEATWKATYQWSCTCFGTVWFFCEEHGQLMYDCYFGKYSDYFDMASTCKKCGVSGGLKSLVRWRKGGA